MALSIKYTLLTNLFFVVAFFNVVMCCHIGFSSCPEKQTDKILGYENVQFNADPIVCFDDIPGYTGRHTHIYKLGSHTTGKRAIIINTK